MKIIKDINDIKEYVRETEELCQYWKQFMPTANVANAEFLTPDAVSDTLQDFRQFGE